MDRRHLEYFLAVAEAGSFTRAAALLNIAQPSLSHTIAALEREVGSQLFVRLGRGVKLTAAGDALLEPARRSVRSFVIAASAVKSVAEGGYGRLTVVSNTLWAMEPLVAVMGEFRRVYPAVQFTVTDPTTRSEVLDSVRHGDADFGLLDGIAPAGALASQWLVDQQLVGVVPAESTLTEQSGSVVDLARHGLISTPRGTALRAMLDEQLEAAGEATEIAVETAHVASVVPLVLAGAGVAVLPQGMAAEAEAKGARLIRLEPPTSASVHLIWRAGRLGSVEQDFLDMARLSCSV